jgi:citrate lyase subunit beta/citryl-CoA lyase
MPLHVLLESAAAVHRAFEIASHRRVQSVSFGLMDFVSSHGGAIPAAAMSVSGQFEHPLVVRAKLEVASACHANGKVPSHCVVTEFRDHEALARSAGRAAKEFGYTRMWSIHPSQIRPILQAMAPSEKDIALACEVLLAAQNENWAPISVGGQLHDRASYRFFWHVLERAHATGRAMPTEAQPFFKP